MGLFAAAAALALALASAAAGAGGMHGAGAVLWAAAFALHLLLALALAVALLGAGLGAGLGGKIEGIDAETGCAKNRGEEEDLFHQWRPPWCRSPLKTGSGRGRLTSGGRIIEATGQARGESLE